MLPLAQQFLRALRIIPKRRVFNAGVQNGEARLGFIPVKDASEGARGIA
jgi:hypothetical protein